MIPELSAHAEFGCPFHKMDANQFGFVSNCSQQSQLLELKRVKYGYHSPGFDLSTLTRKAQKIHHLAANGKQGVCVYDCRELLGVIALTRVV